MATAAHFLLAVGLMLLALTSHGQVGEFRQTLEAATVSFEGPSTRANKQYLYSRGTPLEVIVAIEGWFKVRDAQGGLTWVERRALGERQQVQVVAPMAEVYAQPEGAGPVLFRAETGLLLQLAGPPVGAWVPVRHRDGTSGFIRRDAIFGL